MIVWCVYLIFSYYGWHLLFFCVLGSMLRTLGTLFDLITLITLKWDNQGHCHWYHQHQFQVRNLASPNTPRVIRHLKNKTRFEARNPNLKPVCGLCVTAHNLCFWVSSTLLLRSTISLTSHLHQSHSLCEPRSKMAACIRQSVSCRTAHDSSTSVFTSGLILVC